MAGDFNADDLISYLTNLMCVVAIIGATRFLLQCVYLAKESSEPEAKEETKLEAAQPPTVNTEIDL